MRKLILIFGCLTIVMFATGQTNNSSGNGEWASVVKPSYNVGFGNTVNINHIVRANSQINVALGGTINVGNSIGDSLIINAGLVSVLGGNITINAGAVILINGNLLNTIAGDITVYGTLLVDGDVTNFGSNVVIAAGGVVGVSGNISNTGGGVINNSGTLNVGGVITGNQPIGGGIVTTNDPDPLPIELIYFSGFYTDNSIILKWATATELNNDYFSVERSVDDINYESIAIVAGAGASMTEQNYSYADNNPLLGVSYYRLKQTDYNGQSETFNPVSVTYFNEKTIHLSPVPTSDILNVTVDGSMVNASLKIINMLGDVVRDINQLENQSSIDVSNLPKGIYILSIEGGNSRYVKQVMIK